MNSNCTTSDNSIKEAQGEACQDDRINSSGAEAPNESWPVQATDLGPKSSDDPEIRRKNQSYTSSFQARYTRRVCEFYVRQGYCHFGRRCWFAHPPKSHTHSDPIPVEVADKPVPTDTCEENAAEAELDKSVEPDHTQKQTDSCGENAGKSPVASDLPLKPESKLKPSRSVRNAPRERRTNPRPSGGPQKNCYFFWKLGNCRYGDRCWFQHIPRSTEGTGGVSNSEEHDRKPVENETTVSQEHGEEDKSASVVNDSPADSLQNVVRGRSRRVDPPKYRKPLCLADLTPDGLCDLRTVEINQLKKRFPQSEESSESETGSIITVEFLPSDPDWPFDVDSIFLRVHIPQEYPKERLEIEVEDKSERFPERLLSHINRCVATWLLDRHSNNANDGRTELIFRPFLLWLDKNLEEIFTAGLRSAKREADAKAAGIEFVPFENLPGSQVSECPITPGDIDESVPLPADKTLFSDSDDLPQEDKDSAQLQDKQSEVVPNEERKALKIEPSKRGTEVKFRNLQLGENVGTLGCQKLFLTVQCSRCKTHHEITTPPGRDTAAPCTKCHHIQRLSFHPSLLHQYSDVVGYLDLSGCRAMDLPLMKCTFQLGCLQCSKQMSIDGIHYGQVRATWCQYCNSKLTVFVDSTKFFQLQPSHHAGTGTTHLVKLEAKVKDVRDPAVQEGKPLPQNGACKHFKKSYRWLRFPCCGKAYPCDMCHEEGEDGHEMKYATRMLCGFCAKEQTFTVEKPCIACHSYLTRRSGSHWEGGLGCRDRIKMSRNDHQKYKGVAKTVPNPKLKK